MIATGQLSRVRWGLLPVWTKAPGIGLKLISPRAETAAVKPPFRAAFSKSRCLVPAQGFYELGREGSVRQPWLIARHDGELMAFARSWERWPVSRVRCFVPRSPNAGRAMPVGTFTILANGGERHDVCDSSPDADDSVAEGVRALARGETKSGSDPRRRTCL